MAVIVLVHGAWGTAAELSPIVPLLEAGGHSVINIDLPCTSPDATLGDYRDTVLAAMPSGRRGDAQTLVVGHSFGGSTIGLIREQRPDVALAYVTAVVPQPGESLLQLMLGADPFLADDVTDPWAGFEGFVFSTDPGMCMLDVEAFAMMAPEEMRDQMRAEMAVTQREQGVAAMRQGWPGSALPSGRLTYIVAANDNLISPDLQRTMAAAAGATIHEVPSDHSMFSERPAELAEILVAVARSLDE
jgi:pimeloyl-ACP methyl ester carboxylesterase